MTSPANYVKKLKEPQRKIVQALRNLVKETVPDVKEHHHWNVLYYPPACYITVHGEHVSFGCAHRKHFRLKKLKDIKKRIFSQAIREAMVSYESHR